MANQKNEPRGACLSISCPFGLFGADGYPWYVVGNAGFMELRNEMDLETALYAFAWIAGFIIFLLRFGKLYR